ncbi:MAG: DUF2807 domain-containing protein [Bacteroidetes bacterium]|nr:DUF2807 domain-containing protein [Bacteroidota bacterium]
MKTLIVTLAITAAIATCLSVKAQKGVTYMNDLNQRRQFESFKSISIYGNFNLFLNQLYSEKGISEMVIEAREELLKRIITKVKDDVLYIYADDPENKRLIADIFLSFRDLEHIEAFGNVSIETVDVIDLKEMEVSMNDRSKCFLFVDTDKFSFTAKGHGTTDISARCDDMKLIVCGNSNVTLELEANTFTGNLFDFGTISIVGTTLIEEAEMFDKRIIGSQEEALKQSLEKKSNICRYEKSE